MTCNFLDRKIVELVNETLKQLNYDKKTILFPNKELLNKYIIIFKNTTINFIFVPF